MTWYSNLTYRQAFVLVEAIRGVGQEADYLRESDSLGYGVQPTYAVLTNCRDDEARRIVDFVLPDSEEV